MRLDALERLMERLFGDHREPVPPADAGEAAALAAALRGEGLVVSSPPGDPCELAAAYLDGALEGEARHGFEAALARRPGEREDLESTQVFLDAVAAQTLAAPSDLIEAVSADLAADAAAVREEGTWRRIVLWVRIRPRTMGAVGGAVAVAFSVVLLVSANLDRAVTPFHQVAVPRPTTPPAPAAIAPASAPTPAALPSVPTAPSAPKAEAPIAPMIVPEPAAPAADAEARKQLQIEEMNELGAQQDAIAGAANDPCAHRYTDDSKAKTGTPEADKTTSSKQTSECDNNFADHGLASQPDFGVGSSAADAMPAPADTPDAAGSAMPSAQPDTPPH